MITVQDINLTLAQQVQGHADAAWIQLQVQDDLRHVHDLDKYMAEVILPKKYGWNHKDFHQFKVKQEAFDQFLSTPSIRGGRCATVCQVQVQTYLYNL